MVTTIHLLNMIYQIEKVFPGDVFFSFEEILVHLVKFAVTPSGRD